MALSRVTMSPAHCAPGEQACRIVYEVDSELPRNQQTFNVVEVKNRCSSHSALMVPSTHFSRILEEESWIERVLEAARDLISIENVEGEAEKIQLAFDEGRTVIVRLLVNVSTRNKQRLQEACDQRIGVGKVLIV